MKKIVFAFSVFAALMMSACLPETRNEMLGIPENAILLSSERYAGHGDKTAVNGTDAFWVNGDKVYLNGSEYEVTVSGGKAYVSGDASDAMRSGELYGYYGLTSSTTPSEGNVTVTVPSEYTSSFSGTRQVIALPMVAYKSASVDNVDSIKFRHVTAAVKVRVKNSTANELFLDSVIVSSDANKLSGNVTLTLSEGDLDVDAVSGSGSVKVTFSSASITVGSIKDVQVPILPISEGNLSISVYTHNADITGLPITGLTHTFDATKTVPDLDRNVMLTAQVKIDPVSANVVSKGTFSVSADKAVYFSMGNLKYSRESTSDDWATGTWSFMTNQLALEETTSLTANDYAEATAIGLFAYGTSGIAYSGHATIYQPWYTNTTANNYYTGSLSGESDWGYNTITDCGTGWRTPTGGNTDGEWYYLINTRITSTSGLPAGGGGDNTKARYMMAKIANTYCGLVIFPDKYTHPSDVTIGGGNKIKYNASTNYTATISSTGDWDKMAAAGAVFLRAAGYRKPGFSGNAHERYISNVNSVGYYRSANYCDGTYSYGVTFSSSAVSSKPFANASTGLSVRLVRDAN